MRRSTARFLSFACLVVTLMGAGTLSATWEPQAWMAETPPQPEVVLLRGATVWTSGPEGVLEKADVLVRRGKIVKVAGNISAPRNAEVVDASGMHLTPGLIDCHYHSTILGGVNEGTNITTAEVRIADVLDVNTDAVYQQLAGGLTVANVLHGSANSIGGQNAIIKLRWGATPAEMLFAGAPAGIKFALGENPKQSNWGNNTNPRYPQTRPGVEQSIRERFQAALDYRREWKEFQQSGAGTVPPRRDLQLEAIVEILDGKRLVHSHAYRADEMLMLLQVADEFGFKIATFQHILEGYKIADELAAHGAGASTFSDWWAYKYEVVDAIPWNGAIMNSRNVVVSFNSDDTELARRLNLEAAKAVRYGGVPEDEALQFVTLNPAIQLGIADRVGSIEAGKDADLVLWSGHPLSTYSRVEQTWVDGRKYFDRTADLAQRETVVAERQRLIEKVRAANAEDEAEAEEEAEESEDNGNEEEGAEAPAEEPPSDLLIRALTGKEVR